MEYRYRFDAKVGPQNSLLSSSLSLISYHSLCSLRTSSAWFLSTMTETKRIHGTILYNPSPNLASKHSIYTSGFMQTLWDERKVWFSDMRGQERQFDIDKQGFQVIEHNSSETEFMNEEAIRNTYYPELEDLLKRTSVLPKCCFVFMKSKFSSV